jgi:hypothetical protein
MELEKKNVPSNEELVPFKTIEEVLECRGKLKGFRRNVPASTLELLKRLRASRLDREMIMKTKISKTVMRIAKYKNSNATHDEAKIYQLA